MDTSAYSMESLSRYLQEAARRNAGDADTEPQEGQHAELQAEAAAAIQQPESTRSIAALDAAWENAQQALPRGGWCLAS